MADKLPYKLKIEAVPRWWRFGRNWVVIAEFLNLGDAVEQMEALAEIGYCVEIIRGHTFEDQVLHDHD